MGDLGIIPRKLVAGASLAPLAIAGGSTSGCPNAIRPNSVPGEVLRRVVESHRASSCGEQLGGE
jgi:hypothetical protein